jgi:hypothetical protein
MSPLEELFQHQEKCYVFPPALETLIFLNKNWYSINSSCVHVEVVFHFIREIACYKALLTAGLLGRI